MRPRQLSIRRHLVVALTISLIALYGLSSTVVYFLMSRALTEQLDVGLFSLAKDFIAETERTLDGEIKSGFHDLELEEFEGRTVGGSYYELWDAKGTSVYRSTSLGDDGKLPYNPVEGEEVSFEWVDLPGRRVVRAVQVSFSLKLEVIDHGDIGDAAEFAARTPDQFFYAKNYQANDPQNRAHLVIAADALQHQNTLFILGSTLLGTGIVLILATFFLIGMIVDRACHPLLELEQLTGQIGPDDLAKRLPTDHLPSELLPLIGKFNLFIERLDEAIRRERRFSVGMAHELRTPVTELRTLMEVALASLDHTTVEGPSELTPNEVFQTGSEIGERMGKIIEVLTALYQSDTRHLDVEEVPVEMGALVHTALATFDSTSRDRVQVDEIFVTGPFSSDPSILRPIAENLIKNALVHSPPGSAVALSVRDDGFTVTNQSQDLAASDLENLREPFWQSDAARSSPDQFGLGLTLVDHYVRILGGQLAFSLESDQFSARVELPPPRDLE